MFFHQRNVLQNTLMYTPLCTIAFLFVLAVFGCCCFFHSDSTQNGNSTSPFFFFLHMEEAYFHLIVNASKQQS